VKTNIQAEYTHAIYSYRD